MDMVVAMETEELLRCGIEVNVAQICSSAVGMVGCCRHRSGSHKEYQKFLNE